MDFDCGKIYPPVEFPVSRGTPMIASKIKWNHDQNMFVPKFETSDWLNVRKTIVNISEKTFSFVQGHIIDGKILFPGMAIINLVWNCFADINNLSQENCAVTFDEVEFIRATLLTKDQDVVFTVTIHTG